METPAPSFPAKTGNPPTAPEVVGEAALDLVRAERLLVDRLDADLQRRGQRMPGEGDEALFEPFLAMAAAGLHRGLQRFSIDAFREVEARVRAFEQVHHTRVFKGPLYYGAGLLYLWSGDFDFALFYWARVEDEERSAGLHPGRGVLTRILSDVRTDLYLGVAKHLYDEVGRLNPVCNRLFGDNFHFYAFFQEAAAASPRLLPGLAVNLHRSTRYALFERYAPGRASTEVTDALYYRLVVDFGVQFEAALKDYLGAQGRLRGGALGQIIRNDLHNCWIGDVSAAAYYLGDRKRYGSHDVGAYNRAFRNLTRLIDWEAGRPWRDRARWTTGDWERSRVRLAALLLLFVTNTRNQMAHALDPRCVLWGDHAACRRAVSLIIVASHFRRYLAPR